MAPTNPLASLLGGGHNPFKGLQEHMRSVLQCAEEVPALFDALVAGDQEKLQIQVDQIFALENEADLHKNKLRHHLPRSLLMPVNRRDLLEVLHNQDSIADVAQDIAGLLVVRPMELPDFMRADVLALVEASLDVVRRCARIIEQLDELLEVGFRGRRASKVELMLDELGRAEDQADELELALTKKLFAHEDEMKAVSVMLWYEMFQWIGDLADYAEKVGNRLRLTIAS
jgi:predicted phosphate transport protein (TIGR00153 family)